MMNFKTIKKASLSAVLVATLFQSDTVEAASSMKGDHQSNAEHVTDNAPKVSLSEQEKKLPAEQLEYWKKVKSHREFPKILTFIKKNLDLSKMEITYNKIRIPFEKDRYLSCYKDHSKPSLSIETNTYENGSYIFPSYEVPEFIQDKADCYFYTPKKELKGLSTSEAEYIQTFDKCLNAIYHHMYGYGFTDIDEKKLTSNKYAGYAYDVFHLTKINHTSYSKSVTERALKGIREGMSELEIKFYDQFGYPLKIKDLSEKTDGYFINTGGCFGENLYSNPSVKRCLILRGEGIYANPWATDISKDNKKLEATIYQAHLREKEAILINCEDIDKALPDFLKSIDPSASPQFKKLIDAKVKTIRTYNKLLSRLPKVSSWPKSLAHLKKLDKFIKKNYQDKIKDGSSLR